MQHITNSPISGQILSPFLKCKDYLVSEKEFEILYDKEMDMLVTSPQPNESEIGFYYESNDYISHSNQNTSMFQKVYNGVKEYMLGKKWFWVAGRLPIGNALDIGCGTGSFIKYGQKLGWNMEGVELSEKAREIALEETKTPIKDNLFDPYFDQKKYQLITLWHVLEHLHDTNAYFQRLNTLLEKKGVLAIAVPNFQSFDAKHYGEHWAAYDVPRHLYHFSQKSIEILAEKHGFRIEKKQALVFDSFYVSLLSEEYKYGKKRLLSAFLIGLKSNFKAWYQGMCNYSSIVYILKKQA